ncbi:gliding motility-associated C-terminal domain-containing protein [Marivirga sp. S37H4]|uniref:Gliding motility-associated C-terminal domain-containing protein n=1 Tax=Marivirga aurantiaca TaxID=2802615 RepID=A0A934X1K5_9BACT|nr:gliding motility-associated C-terminal domain-containing protein [Marivirga aurantiaca]MBK6266796.1 gliding motility-associated C-terminal domain-containing protein [Marivirga aurantiaca]
MKNLLLAIVIILSVSTTAHATHIRAGEITAKRLGCNGFTYEFTLTAYRDTGSEILFGNGIFDFGDGETVSLNPEGFFKKELIDDEIEMVQFKLQHTYSGNGSFTVSYNEDYRNANIVNMNNSVTVPFFVETTIRLDPFFGCNDSPVFLIPPIDKGAVGVLFFHNPGAFDINGDSISFKMTIPQSRSGVNVPNYRFPDVAGGGQNSQQTGPATYTLDEILGDVIWDAPGMQGEFNIAFIAEEWRKISGEWRFLGSVTRDMQIIIGETDNDPPELEIPLDTCIEAGALLEAQIIATDPNEESLVKIEAFGGPFTLSPAATLSPDPAVFSESPTTSDFSWQTTCDHIREDPYLIRFKATDNGPGIRLTSFETWSVTVVPPSPKNVVAESKPQRSIEISWDAYDCGLAEVIQVYRRVDSFDFDPENCEIGIPENGGYELVGAVPVAQNSFLDDNAGRGLDFGAQYCYRLVAIFELPTGGVSYASEEVCQKIAATGPIITNVSIESTSLNNGEITVSWLDPFEIDTAIYPPPYKYQLLRGANGIFNPIAVVENDTTYTDTGLNTEEETYNYRLELYPINAEVNEDNLIEISANASTVSLGSVSLFEAIQLKWDANVPWSNTNQAAPYHYIYRNKVNTDSTELVLIDSVDVTQYGYQYIDSGAFNNKKLSNNKEYCYFVTTSGSYGNDDIFEPLLNNSQILCSMPDDNIDPCPPFEVSFKLNSEDDCLAFLADKECEFNQFENTLLWEANLVDSCDASISYYEIYYTNTLEGEFELIGTTTETSFTHENLPEFAGCYRIRAVDQSENRSPFSEIFCKENCPNIAFPNVFTPNDDERNDIFTPFYQGASYENSIPFDKCPRFLEKIEFKVYNRYGKQVYSYTSGGENSLYINWDGTNFNGEELPSATYFYEALVTFKMLRPSNKQKFYKGWVQIIR